MMAMQMRTPGRTNASKNISLASAGPSCGKVKVVCKSQELFWNN